MMDRFYTISYVPKFMIFVCIYVVAHPKEHGTGYIQMRYVISVMGQMS